MTNSPPGVRPSPGSNLRSKQKFQDYPIHAEYKLDNGSHSGIYWRGRYEMQVLGDMGKPPDQFSHMSVYGWKAPARERQQAGQRVEHDGRDHRRQQDHA